MRYRLQTYFKNPTSVVGGIVALVCFGASVVLLITDMIQGEGNPYRTLLSLGLFPALMMLAAGLAIVGAYLEGRRLNRTGAIPGVPRPSRFAGKPLLTLGLIGFGLFFLAASSVGGYQAYKFTDSIHFCGEICHEVMEPEWVTYHNSAHARVDCVACHIGEGTEWYVKAKLRGAHQMYAMAANSHARPIPTPIDNLRPARDTCEKCHWPTRPKQWGTRLLTRTHFSRDFSNTRRELVMNLDFGGGGSASGLGKAIHWHMNVGEKVEYAARDRQRIDIAWVRVTKTDGTVEEYRDTVTPITDDELAKLEKRESDCMDCHNRPAHAFLSPEESAERLLLTGQLSVDIPYARAMATDLLAKEYATSAEAAQGIEEGFLAMYREKHPEVLPKHEQSIRDAVPALKEIYAQNNFPAMKARWEVYPNHIGHRDFPGCFRCHTPRLKSATGKTISEDCNLCHKFALRPDADHIALTPVSSRAAFIHPWQTEHDVQCWECHKGGMQSEFASCRTCHDDPPSGGHAKFTCSQCHMPMHTTPSLATAPSVAVSSCVRCHSAEDSEGHAVVGHTNCTTCHKPHEWSVKTPASCIACHADYDKNHNPGEDCTECHDFSEMSSELVALPRR